MIHADRWHWRLVVCRPRKPHRATRSRDRPLMFAHQYLGDPIASRTASQLSVQHILEGPVLKREVCVHPLQLCVLHLELPAALDVGDRRATVLSGLEERVLY